jgi:hypothetical protein
MFTADNRATPPKHNAPITAERIAGGWLLATMLNGTRHAQRYFGFRKRDALWLFRNSLPHVSR